MSGFIGTDLSLMDPDAPIGAVKSNGIQSILENLQSLTPGRNWNVGDIGNTLDRDGAQLVIVGSPNRVVDELERWVDETDLDGFNLVAAIKPGSFEDIVDLIVPEMQRRGIYKPEYTLGTWREKLFGASPYTPSDHPAAKIRKSA